MNLLKRIKIGILYILGSKQAEYAISPARQTLDQWEEIVTHYAKENKEAKELKKQALAIIEAENVATKHYEALVAKVWHGAAKSPHGTIDASFDGTIKRVVKLKKMVDDAIAHHASDECAVRQLHECKEVLRDAVTEARTGITMPKGKDLATMLRQFVDWTRANRPRDWRW